MNGVEVGVWGGAVGVSIVLPCSDSTDILFTNCKSIHLMQPELCN